MAIPSRQIGWGTTDNLLWEISKQIEGISCVVACGTSGSGSSGTSGVTGSSGTSGASFGTSGTSGVTGTSGTTGLSGTSGVNGVSNLYYGSFFSDQDQSLTSGGVGVMTLNNIDFAQGVSIVSGSRITLANAGKYNIQFSAQLHNTGGGGSGTNVNIWFRKNGLDISQSNSRVNVNTNSPYVIAAWNFFVNAAAGDYYEIAWSPDNGNTILEHEDAGDHPAIPSLIVTVNQIG